MDKETLLVEYKKEAFNLFENLLNKLKIDFVTILINLKVVQEKIDEDSNIKRNTIKALRKSQMPNTFKKRRKNFSK
jgi:preprotein translocase subunit SecA